MLVLDGEMHRKGKVDCRRTQYYRLDHGPLFQETSELLSFYFCLSTSDFLSYLFFIVFFLKSYFRYSATDALKFVGIERDVDFALR